MTSTPNSTTQSTNSSVAVIGGGIAGLCLTLGLLKHPHIDVHVYESARTFSEFGAGVEIGPNAQTSLRLLSPLAERAFTETTTPNLWPSHEKVFCDYIVVSNSNYTNPIWPITVPRADEIFSFRVLASMKASSYAPKSAKPACKVCIAHVFSTSLLKASRKNALISTSDSSRLKISILGVLYCISKTAQLQLPTL